MTNCTTYTEFEQNSDLWHFARLGLPTASCFQLMMRKGVGAGKESLTRGAYIHELAAELITGVPITDGYVSKEMERGRLWEPDAMAAYELQADGPVDRVGFIRNTELNIGCSPDGLIGKDGGVEIKTLSSGLMCKLKRFPGIPPEHMAQLQGSMLVTGRQWWDFVAYSPNWKLYVERVGRSESYMDELKRYLAPFQAELEKAVQEATEGDDTWKALRKLRDKQLTNRIEEERLCEELEASAEDVLSAPGKLFMGAGE